MNITRWWGPYKKQPLTYRISIASLLGAIILALPATLIDIAIPADASSGASSGSKIAANGSVGQVSGGTVNIYNAPVTQILSSREPSLTPTVTAQNLPSIYAPGSPGSIISPFGGNNAVTTILDLSHAI